MPPVKVVFYKEVGEEDSPVLEWMEELPEKHLLKIRGRLGLLESKGIELLRPHADYLGEDLYELRVKVQKHNYRLLYSFHERVVVIVLHGIIKQRAQVGEAEINVARNRLTKFRMNPQSHILEE